MVVFPTREVDLVEFFDFVNEMVHIRIMPYMILRAKFTNGFDEITDALCGPLHLNLDALHRRCS